MKVRDLIAALQREDPDILVYVRGSEAGLDDVVRLTRVTVERDYYGADEWWNGRHSEEENGESGLELVG